MNTNRELFDNGVSAFFIQPGDTINELGLVLSILLMDKAVLLFVDTALDGNRVFDYPYDTLFELA